MSEKTVFISYRRDTAGNLFARLVEGALTRRGYDVFLDVDCIDAGEWAKRILTQVPKRAHFLLLLTPGALDRCADETDWVRREFLVARERGRNVVPVREESVDLDAMRAAAPGAVKAIFDLQIHTIRHGTFESDVETLTTRYIPPHKAPKEGIPISIAFQADISRIIKYAPADLIGREAETKLLSRRLGQSRVRRNEDARTSSPSSPWAARGRPRWSRSGRRTGASGLAGMRCRFRVVVLQPGHGEQTAVSSDAFLAEALTFFGDPAMAGSAQGAFDKGRRLAQLVGERRALLILDGVEPLQYAPTSPTPGELKDQGLAALLKGLAATSLGFCVVTTRYAIAGLCAPSGRPPRRGRVAASLDGRRGDAAPDHRRKTGSQAEFEKLVEDVDGHALTLQPPRTVPRACLPGDIRRRDRIDIEKAERRSRAARPSGRWRPT